jgi:peptidyl-prolyl cis-trans isomerase B (cyclophilin B)
VSTNQQRREAAKRKLERQQARRAQRSARRKKVAATTAGAIVIALVAVVVVACAVNSSPSSPAPPPPPQAAGGRCAYQATPDEPAAKPVSVPTDLNPPADGTVQATMTTSQGVLPITLNRAEAPCTVASFVHLAQAGYFNNTPCHRLVTEGSLKVLQCGDPSGTGSGGPGYTIPDEKPTTLKPGQQGASVYPRGVLAMANTGQPNSGGSQFFLVYADSQLPPDYTVFGTVSEPGIKVLEKVAAAGDDGSLDSSAGGGKPKLPTSIQSVSVAG